MSFTQEAGGGLVIMLTRRYRVIQTASWGYPTEGAYYRDASSDDALTAVKIPFLAISAEDDPVRRF